MQTEKEIVIKNGIDVSECKHLGKTKFGYVCQTCFYPTVQQVAECNPYLLCEDCPNCLYKSNARQNIFFNRLEKIEQGIEEIKNYLKLNKI